MPQHPGAHDGAHGALDPARPETKRARPRVRAREADDWTGGAFAPSTARDGVLAMVRTKPGISGRTLEAVLAGTDVGPAVYPRAAVRRALAQLVTSGEVVTRPGPKRAVLHYLPEHVPVQPAEAPPASSAPWETPAPPAPVSGPPSARSTQFAALVAEQPAEQPEAPESAAPLVGPCPACGRPATAQHLADDAPRERIERTNAALLAADAAAIAEQRTAAMGATAPAWVRGF